MTAVVIGYGNRLRRDDGAGPRLAEWLARRRRPGLVVRACHQLTPELVALLPAANRVLFIDAALALAGPRLQPLRPAPPRAPEPCSHALTPQQLLALAQLLLGAEPVAWQLLIPAHQLQLGEGLSPATAAACRAARPLLRRWFKGDA
jgi:hydrogenase maturation protease